MRLRVSMLILVSWWPGVLQGADVAHGDPRTPSDPEKILAQKRELWAYTTESTGVSRSMFLGLLCPNPVAARNKVRFLVSGNRPRKDDAIDPHAIKTLTDRKFDRSCRCNRCARRPVLPGPHADAVIGAACGASALKGVASPSQSTIHFLERGKPLTLPSGNSLRYIMLIFGLTGSLELGLSVMCGRSIARPGSSTGRPGYKDCPRPMRRRGRGCLSSTVKNVPGLSFLGAPRSDSLARSWRLMAGASAPWPCCWLRRWVRWSFTRGGALGYPVGFLPTIGDLLP